MREIFIKQQQASGYQQAYMVDESHALYSNDRLISLVEVIPIEVEGRQDTFAPVEPYASIYVAVGGSFIEELREVVERLKSMSAYELLTEHYFREEEAFLVNLRAKEHDFPY